MADEQPYVLVGTVTPDQMPDTPRAKRGGIWTELADKLIADYKAGFVTVVAVTDEASLDRLRNGVRWPLRQRDTHVRLVTSVVPQDGRYQVYLRLVNTE